MNTLDQITRTLTTRKGMTVETTLTDADALRILNTISNSFAEDLAYKARRYGLSVDQMAWAHKLAMEKQNPPAPKNAVSIGSMLAVITMFTNASKHLKHPKVRLAVGLLNEQVCLSIAGPRANIPGSITVTDGGKYGEGKWYGRIRRDGSYEPSRNAPAGIETLLRRFAEDPETVASEFGRLTGQCCFCNSSLKDERSTEVGYGPTCAQHFGLSWGSKIGWNVRQTPAIEAVEETAVV